jgi:hypothetical protein
MLSRQVTASRASISWRHIARLSPKLIECFASKARLAAALAAMAGMPRTAGGFGVLGIREGDNTHARGALAMVGGGSSFPIGSEGRCSGPSNRVFESYVAILDACQDAWRKLLAEVAASRLGVYQSMIIGSRSEPRSRAELPFRKSLLCRLGVSHQLYERQIGGNENRAPNQKTRWTPSPRKCGDQG